MIDYFDVHRRPKFTELFFWHTHDDYGFSLDDWFSISIFGWMFHIGIIREVDM